MKKLFLAGVVLFGASMMFTACEKDEKDVEKPVIKLNDPADDEEIKIGDEHGIHFDAEFSDNEELASYKVDIHSNFDGHTHSAMRSIAADSVAFSFQKSWNTIAGKRNADVHHHEIVIPETFNGKPIKEGHYHIVIYCLDKAGNEAHVARDIELSYDAEEHHHEH